MKPAWALLVASAGLVLGCAVDNRALGDGADEDEAGDDSASAGNAGDVPVGASGNGAVGAGLGGTGPGNVAGAGGASSSAGAANTAGGSNAGGSSAGGSSNAGGATGQLGSSGAAGAAPIPGPIAAGCGEQLLGNGDFDAGQTGWADDWDIRATVVEGADPLLAAEGVTPFSGNYLAWLGGVANGEYGQKHMTRISQMVTIPSNTVALTFSGYIWVEQPQLGVTPTIDWVVLEFLDPLVTEGYDNVWQVAIWNEENVSPGWVPFSLEKTLDLDRLRGRTLPVVADSRPDGNGTLNVWLDSLRLEARCDNP